MEDDNRRHKQKEALVTPRTATQKSPGSDLIYQYHSNNSRASTNSNNVFSISNYKTPSSNNLVSRETPLFKSKNFSKLSNHHQSPQVLDSKLMLSDHIKKHVRASKNSYSQQQAGAPKTADSNFHKTFQDTGRKGYQ